MKSKQISNPRQITLPPSKKPLQHEFNPRVLQCRFQNMLKNQQKPNKTLSPIKPQKPKKYAIIPIKYPVFREKFPELQKKTQNFLTRRDYSSEFIEEKSRKNRKVFKNADKSKKNHQNDGSFEKSLKKQQKNDNLKLEEISQILKHSNSMNFNSETTEYSSFEKRHELWNETETNFAQRFPLNYLQEKPVFNKKFPFEISLENPNFQKLRCFVENERKKKEFKKKKIEISRFLDVNVMKETKFEMIKRRIDSVKMEDPLKLKGEMVRMSFLL